MNSRAPFQVLVLPYMHKNKFSEILYAVFQRNKSTGDYWQGIAGGGELGESHLEAAKREAFEEAGIDRCNDFEKLDSITTIPVVNICGFKWGRHVLVVPEYTFAVKISDSNLRLSSEHADYKWMSYDDAYSILHWDSNRNALWELNYKLKNSMYLSKLELQTDLEP